MKSESLYQVYVKVIHNAETREELFQIDNLVLWDEMLSTVECRCLRQKINDLLRRM